MELNPQQVLTKMDQLEITHFEDLSKNNQKFKMLWASCSKRGPMFIFNFESVAQKLLQQRNISDVLDDMIITILVVEWYLKQIAGPDMGKTREQMNSYRPENPPTWLIDQYQKQEILIRYLGETKTFWFNQSIKLHRLLGQGYQPKDLIDIALLFQEVGKSVNHILKLIE